MNIAETVKEHPYAIGGGILIAIVIFMYMRGGAAPASGSQDLGSVYQAQAAAQTATQEINAKLAGEQLSANTNLTALQLTTQGSYNIATLQQQTELAKINATQEMTDLANTLSANVSIKQIQGQTDVAQINANVQENMYNNLAQTLITQAQTNAAVSTAAINAAASANQCHGIGCWF